ncbi:MAG: type II secretion system minor pseudopilin GspJ [Sphingomonadales bacterium]|nr:type II secretion system minor pseudopilin GspJ [Sphingomonadales bacterium]
MTARANGFTLVEVVVALFIFAMLATAGVSLLSFTVKAQSATARVLSDVSDERRLSALLINDLGQAVPRVSRDEAGRPRPAFQANQGDLLFAFVRGGTKPQHVEIRLDKGTLVRMATPFVDGATVGKALVLETGVERTKLRFRNKSDWQDDWSSERTDAIPRALELTLVRQGAAPITRMFLVGTGE